MLRTIGLSILLCAAMNALAQWRVGGALGGMTTRVHTATDGFHSAQGSYAGRSPNMGAELRLYAETLDDSVGYLRCSLGCGVRRIGLADAWGSTHFASQGVDLDLTLQQLDLSVGYSFPIQLEERLQFRVNISITAAALLLATATGGRDDFIMVTATDSTGAVLGSFPSTERRTMEGEALHDIRTLNIGGELGGELVSRSRNGNDLFFQFGGRLTGMYWDALGSKRFSLFDLFLRAGVRVPLGS